MSNSNNNYMASPAVAYRPHQRWSLNDLSTELLILIIEQVHIQILIIGDKKSTADNNILSS